MRRKLLVLLLFLALFPALAQESVLLSKREDPLAPFAAKIAFEAFRRIGVKADFVQLPSERALQSADNGQTDGDLVRAAGIDKLYPNLVQVPEPMLTYDTVAFTKGLGFKIDGWESLRPFRLCVLRGMKLAETATEGMDRAISNDVAQAIMMLGGGRCDVALLGYVVWPEIDRMMAGPLRSLDPPVSSVPLYLYVNKKHASLVKKLAEAMREMRADGTTDKILGQMEKGIQEARQRNAMPTK